MRVDPNYVVVYRDTAHSSLIDYSHGVTLNEAREQAHRLLTEKPHRIVSVCRIVESITATVTTLTATTGT